MWTPLLFTLLVAAASAEYGWKPNSEYRYEIRGKTLASLQQVSDQYSGVYMRAQLNVQPKSANHLVAWISEAEYAQVQANLPQGLESHIPKEQLQYQKLPITNEPFEIKLQKGVVEDLIISQNVPVWEVNIIRSIVSQLQVDTQGKNLINSKLNSIPHQDQNTGTFKTMEDTVDGECEVLYDITPLPKYQIQRMPHLAPQPQLAGEGQLIDIVKTKNYSRCDQRPAYHFGLTGIADWEPNTNQMKNFFSRSSVSRIVISGDLKKYTIQSSVTVNKVILSPEIYNNQKGEVVSQVNLTLASVHATSGDVQKSPSNPQPVRSLVYDFNNPLTKDHETRQKWNERRQRQSAENTSSEEQKRNSRSISEEMNQFNKEQQKHSKNEGRDKQYRKYQQRRHESSSSESDSVSNEDWQQEKPSMHQAPETPFLPFFIGYMGESIQASKDVNVNQIVRKISEVIAKQLQEPNHIAKEETLERFTILTEIVRTMNYKQLEQTTQELYSREQSQESQQRNAPSEKLAAWMTFRDAVVESGTGPALMLIKQWIKNHQIQGEEAAQIVAALQRTSRFPTAEYMKNFFELVKDSEVVRQANLNTSAIFSFSNLVRMSQVDRKTAHSRYPVHTYGRLSDKHEKAVTEEYIPYFAEQLRKAVQNEDSHKTQVYIRALGNTAHPKIVRVFEPYLEGKQPMTEFQRTLVVVSLNKMAKVHPKLARSILYKTYANTGEAYQVRVAAVYNLMKTSPPASMLQRMAEFTHQDPSNQVRSAVKSAIESAAQLTGEENIERRQNAEAAVDMLTQEKFSAVYSHQNLTDYVLQGLNLAYTQSFSYIGSEDSLIPHTIFYHLTHNVNGWKKPNLGVGAMVSSIDNLMDILQDKFEGPNQQQYAKTQRNQQNQSGKEFTFEWINNILQPENRITKQLEGNILINLAGEKRFYTFNNHSVEALPQQLRHLVQLLKNGKNFSYQKMYNKHTLSIGLPTATGLPFVYTLNTPTLISAVGKVQAQAQPEQEKQQGPLRIPQAVNAAVEVQLMYASRVEAKLGFVTPFDHQTYVAGYNRNLQVQLPVKAKLDIDLRNGHVKVQMKPLDENKEHQIFHYSSKPYTAQQNVLEFKPISESQKYKKIHVRESQKFEQQYGQNTGILVKVQAQTEKKYVDFKSMYDQILRHSLTSVYAYPTAEQTIEATKVELVYDAQRSSAKSVVLTASFQQQQKEQQQEQEQQQDQQKNNAIPSNQSPDSQARRQEFLNRAQVKDGSSSVVDLSLEIQGQQPAQYIATVAVSSSRVNENARLLAYVQKNVQNEKYEICLDAASRMPNTPMLNYAQALQNEPKAQIRGQLNFGEQCQSGAQINLQGKLERSQERLEYLRQHLQPQAQREMEKGNKLSHAQEKLAQEASLLNKYTLKMKYENVPEKVKNMTYQVYSVMRHLGYPYMSENPMVKNEQGHLEVKLNIAADFESANVKIASPAGDSQFHNIRLNKYAAKALTIHPMYSTYQRLSSAALAPQYDGSCVIDKNTIRTFDNQTYKMELGKVWHVIMQSNPNYDFDSSSASDEEDFSEHSVVLARENESGEKEIKLIFGNAEDTEVHVQSGRVSINKEQVQITAERPFEYMWNGRVLVRAMRLESGELRIEFPLHKLELVHHEGRARLIVGQDYMNDVRGLCGTHNGDKYDFITPQSYVLQKPEEFVATWALSNEGRIGELKQRAQQHSMYKKEIVLANTVSEQDAGRADSRGRQHKNMKNSGEYDSSSESREDQDRESSEQYELRKNSATGCSTKRIIAIEKDGKHCFSLRPQPTCAPKCQREQTKTRIDKFFCVEKSKTSEHWVSLIQRGANPDFRNKGSQQEMEYSYPIKCSRN